MHEQSPARVLIVEGRGVIARRLMRVVRRTDGITFAGLAMTVTEALDQLYALRPQLMVVDATLLGGAGLDLIRAATRVGWKCEVLVLSMSGVKSRVLEAVQAGASGYVVKGHDLDRVGENMLSVLKGGSPISAEVARPLLQMVRDAGPVRPAPDVAGLTKREVQVLKAIARGGKREEVATELGITAGTVGNHVTSIYRKLEVTSNTAAAAKAARMGIL